jgi:hypothetical protein
MGGYDDVCQPENDCVVQASTLMAAPIIGRESSLA